MSNPYDLGRDVGKLLAGKLLVERSILCEASKKKRVVAVYAGRFQPFHKGHYSVYKHLVDKFGVENVFIASSNKVDLPKSPFPFNEKQKIINQMFDVPADKIRQVKSPFAPEEVLDDFDAATTTFVTAFSEKDAGRLGAGKYFKELPDDGEDLEGYRERGYFIVAPVFKLEVGGKNISGTQIRAVFGNPKSSPKAKEALFKKLYGKSNPEMLKLVVKRSTEAETSRRNIEKSAPASGRKPTEKKQREPGNLGDKRIVNPETGRRIKIKSALGYDKSHPAHKAAEQELQSEVIEIPVEIGDTILTGRFKNKKIVVKTIGKDEHGMPTINGRKVATFRIVKPVKTEGKDMISRRAVVEYRKRVQQLAEGGAAGHMAHPFDDFSLTFGDLKQIIEMGLEGTLNVESPVTEKLDGQNISVSYKDGKGVVFARNKGHMKDFGANALSVSGVRQMFAGRGELTKAFSFAAEDLNKAISKLSQKQRDKIFAQGAKWMSMEIIFPTTQNVIPYGHNMLIFHNTIEVDDKGNALGVGADDGRMLAGMIKQINQDVQKNFRFGGPVVVSLPRTENFSRKKGQFVGRLTRLQNQFGLRDNDTIMMWHQRWWEDFIDTQAVKFRYGMPNNVRQGLLKRWAFSKSGDYRISVMKKEINHSKFLDWVLNFDKGSKEAQFKKNIAPFEKIFLQLGAEILQNVRGLLSVSPGKAAESLRKELDKTIRELQKTSDVDQLKKVNAQLRKLNSIGIEKLVPTEGIVFMFKGKLFKFTGTFAPMNQLIGILKFG